MKFFPPFLFRKPLILDGNLNLVFDENASFSFYGSSKFLDLMVILTTFFKNFEFFLNLSF
jgi:hypothetical protein